MEMWLMSNRFFWDYSDEVWYSVGYTQQFKARLDATFNPHFIDLYIPWGSRNKGPNKGETLWKNIGGSTNGDKLTKLLAKYNLPVGLEVNGEIQPKYLAI